MTTKRGTIIAVKFDRDTLERVNEIAKAERKFEGNRSLFVRQAVYELISRYESAKGQEKAA